eukprot:6179449-Pleurochrysis_carterae.AAC.2
MAMRLAYPRKLTQAVSVKHRTQRRCPKTQQSDNKVSSASEEMCRERVLDHDAQAACTSQNFNKRA